LTNNEDLVLEVHGPRWANQQGFLHLSEEDSGCASIDRLSTSPQLLKSNQTKVTKKIQNELVVRKQDIKLFLSVI
jgi:hypothetical protein